MTATRGSWLDPKTCTATIDTENRGTIRCTRYRGHPGDHEEWLDKAGDPIAPRFGRLMATWAMNRPIRDYLTGQETQ